MIKIETYGERSWFERVCRFIANMFSAKKGWLVNYTVSYYDRKDLRRM